jgi:hypothetical protein
LKMEKRLSVNRATPSRHYHLIETTWLRWR